MIIFLLIVFFVALPASAMEQTEQVQITQRKAAISASEKIQRIKKHELKAISPRRKKAKSARCKALEQMNKKQKKTTLRKILGWRKAPAVEGSLIGDVQNSKTTYKRD